MSGYWWAPDDYAEALQQGFGVAHSVSGEPQPYDPAAAVRQVATEVTGKRFDPPKKPIGFYRDE